MKKTTTGTDYRFNQEGNQVKYFYTVEEITQIDYDRNMVKNLVKKYLKETNDISAKLDVIEINTTVNHIPLFDITTSFEDSITEYMKG